MIIGNNIPTGVEKVTIDGEKVREKLNLISGLDYQIFHIEHKKNYYTTNSLFIEFRNSDHSIDCMLSEDDEYVLDLDKDYYFNLSRSQPYFSIIPKNYLSTNLNNGYIDFSNLTDSNQNFTFNSFQFNINPRSILINGIDYSQQLFKLLHNKNYHEEQDNDGFKNGQTVIYKTRILGKTDSCENLLILYFASQYYGNYEADYSYSHDIVVFYPVLKAIK